MIVESPTRTSYELDAEADGVGDSPQSARNEALAAKSNRKIADLEITNKSLLAINTILEADKHRMAKEIRDLRRRLREQRLSMPPQAFRALVRHEQRAATLSPSPSGGNPASTTVLPLAGGQVNIFADDDEEVVGDEDEDEEALLKQPDPEYERITALVDALLFHAHEALSEPAVQPSSALLGATEGPASTKVLSPAEVAEHYKLRRNIDLGLNDDSVHHEGDVSVDHDSTDDGASSVGDDHPNDPTLIPLPDGSELTDSSFS